jgi:hypothetical protein
MHTRFGTCTVAVSEYQVFRVVSKSWNTYSTLSLGGNTFFNDAYNRNVLILCSLYTSRNIVATFVFTVLYDALPPRSAIYLALADGFLASVFPLVIFETPSLLKWLLQSTH